MKFIQDMESCTERCFLDHRSFVEERSDAADFPVEELYNWNRDGTGMDRPFTQSIPEFHHTIFALTNGRNAVPQRERPRAKSSERWVPDFS